MELKAYWVQGFCDVNKGVRHTGEAVRVCMHHYVIPAQRATAGCEGDGVRVYGGKQRDPSAATGGGICVVSTSEAIGASCAEKSGCGGGSSLMVSRNCEPVPGVIGGNGTGVRTWYLWAQCDMACRKDCARGGGCAGVARFVGTPQNWVICAL